jgi:universal stress protein E
MHVPQKIMVGVDPIGGITSASLPLDPVAETTLRHALWLAEQCRARLTFFSVLPHANADEDAVRERLLGLVGRAREQAITAEAVTARGQGWLEITRKVERDRHDLLIVGTHDPHGLRRVLLGSTAQTLLHECPCPVWVCKPDALAAPRHILVASNLAPLSEVAVQLGLAIGHFAGAHTFLLDVIEYPLDRIWVPNPADSGTRQYHSRERAAADQELHAQVQRSGGASPDATVTVHVAEGDGIPDHAIVKFVHDHHIDLLVLGTHARHGVAGVLLGNTAERLLPQVPCSVLAVKPADFRTR